MHTQYTAKKHPQYCDAFMYALKAKMRHNVITTDHFDSRSRQLYIYKISKTASIGELLDILYYNWELWNDFSMFCEYLEDVSTWRGDKDYLERVGHTHQYCATHVTTCCICGQ